MARQDDILRETPSQTAGPYVHIGCTPGICGVASPDGHDLGGVMVAPDTPGERIVITGHIYDGAGTPLKDALVEIWQADHNGEFSVIPEVGNVPRFTGWGRQATDFETGRFRFETIKPGAIRNSDETQQAPHVSFWIVARGINLGLNTRMYFPDAHGANATCSVLSQVDARFRHTLIAHCQQDVYTFDIHLQGDNETVFFDI